MASACLCLGGTYVKAQERLWSSVSSGFSPGFGRSLCAWLLEHRRSSSWKSPAEGSCTNDLIFLRSCPFRGHLYPRCYRISILPLCGQHMFLQSLRESVSMAAWEDEDSLAPKAGRHVPSCTPSSPGWEILWLCAALSLLEPPPLPLTLNHCRHSTVTAARWSVVHHQNPRTRPTWHHPCWLSLTLLAPWYQPGCVSGCPLRGFLTTNVHEKGNEARTFMG